MFCYELRAHALPQALQCLIVCRPRGLRFPNALNPKPFAPSLRHTKPKILSKPGNPNPEYKYRYYFGGSLLQLYYSVPQDPTLIIKAPIFRKSQSLRNLNNLCAGLGWFWLPYHCSSETFWSILGGSWDLVSMVIRTLMGVISSYKYSYPNNNSLSY